MNKILILVVLLSVTFAHNTYPVSSFFAQSFSIFKSYFDGRMMGLGMTNARVDFYPCSQATQDVASIVDDVVYKYQQDKQFPALFVLRQGGRLADRLEQWKLCCGNLIPQFMRIAQLFKDHPFATQPRVKLSIYMMNALLHGKDILGDLESLITVLTSKDKNFYQVGKLQSQILQSIFVLDSSLLPKSSFNFLEELEFQEQEQQQQEQPKKKKKKGGFGGIVKKAGGGILKQLKDVAKDRLSGGAFIELQEEEQQQQQNQPQKKKKKGGFGGFVKKAGGGILGQLKGIAKERLTGGF